MLLTSNWRDWYRFKHQEKWWQSGTAFETYVTTILARFHDDFINPDPAGSLGDGGCDGIADAGSILYACYGQRPLRNAERELTNKINSDFTRGFSQWTTFSTWRFVTNAPVGPDATRALTTLQQQYATATPRQVDIRLMRSQDLWDKVIGTFDASVLDDLFPGAPGSRNIELDDLLPLLETLGDDSHPVDIGAALAPVPPNKMEFNDLPEPSKLEFNAGRLLAPRIDRWYAEAADPSLYDTHGERFRQLYSEARQATPHAAEILERLYVAVAGENFRMDGRRANSAYAVVSYFFDSCHIFETPPPAGPPTPAAIHATSH